MTTKTITYKTVPGADLLADVHVPDAAGPRPVLVWLHGGALIAGGRKDLRGRRLDLYLEAGYVVVSADYRLAPETKLAEIAADVRDLFAWVREELPKAAPADPARFVVGGGSAGGYLTLLAGAMLQPGPRALVSFYGYGDIIGDWYRRPDPFYCRQPAVPEAEARGVVNLAPVCTGSDWDPRGRFYLWCRQQGRWPQEVAGFDPEAEPEAFGPYCPVQHVTPAYPPTLLLHGDRDTDVPYEQSVLMDRALTRAGVRHEFITIPGGGHGFDNQDTPEVKEAFRRVLGFLERVL